MTLSLLRPTGALLALCVCAGTLASRAAHADPEVSFSGIGQAYFTRARPVKPPLFGATAGYALSGTVEDTSDTGIRFGATVRVGSGDYGQGDDSPGHNEKVTLNEAFFFAETVWGRFRLGDDDGAADRAVDLLPTLVGGQMSGDWMSGMRTPPPAGYLGRDSDDATKILYQTPRLLGVQLGVSWAPKRRSLVEDIVKPSGGIRENHLVEVAGNYRGDAGALSYELGAAWTRGSSTMAGVAGSDALSAAALLLYGGFSLGAVWFDNADSAQPYHTGQTGGATVQGTYQNGPYGVTLFWHQSEMRRELTWRAYGIGTEWEAVPQHLKVGLDLIRTQALRPAPGADEKGHVLSLTLRASF